MIRREAGAASRTRRARPRARVSASGSRPRGSRAFASAVAISRLAARQDAVAAAVADASAAASEWSTRSCSIDLLTDRVPRFEARAAKLSPASGPNNSSFSSTRQSFAPAVGESDRLWSGRPHSRTARGADRPAVLQQSARLSPLPDTAAVRLEVEFHVYPSGFRRLARLNRARRVALRPRTYRSTPATTARRSLADMADERWRFRPRGRRRIGPGRAIDRDRARPIQVNRCSNRATRDRCDRRSCSQRVAGASRAGSTRPRLRGASPRKSIGCICTVSARPESGPRFSRLAPGAAAKATRFTDVVSRGASWLAGLLATAGPWRRFCAPTINAVRPNSVRNAMAAVRWLGARHRGAMLRVLACGDSATRNREPHRASRCPILTYMAAQATPASTGSRQSAGAAVGGAPYSAGRDSPRRSRPRSRRRATPTRSRVTPRVVAGCPNQALRDRRHAAAADSETWQAANIPLRWLPPRPYSCPREPTNPHPIAAPIARA